MTIPADPAAKVRAADQTFPCAFVEPVAPSAAPHIARIRMRQAAYEAGVRL